MGWRNADDRQEAAELNEAADQASAKGDSHSAENLRALAHEWLKEPDGSTSYSSARALSGKSN